MTSESPGAGPACRRLRLCRPIAWTGESAQLIFSRQDTSPDAATVAEIWTLPVKGGNARKLATFDKTGHLNVQVHPDGRHTTFSAGEDSAEVWVIHGLRTSRRRGRRGTPCSDG